MPVLNGPVSLSCEDLQGFERISGESGPEKRFLCPFCGDSKPKDGAHRSMAVNTQTGLYNCHRCHSRGQLREYSDQGSAPKRLKSTQRLKQGFSLRMPSQSTLRSSTLYDWREFAANTQPLPDTRGESYLRNRGIGLAVQPAITRENVHFHPAYFHSKRPALLFTFVDQDREPVAVSARYVLGAGTPHQTLGPKKRGVFYTLPELWASPLIVLTEAPIDALSLMACGVPAVALGGCDWPEWLPVACGLKNVVLAFDNDEAGDKAAERIRPELEALGAKTARLRPRGEKDWNEILIYSGPDKLKRFLCARLRHIGYFRFGLKATDTPLDWWPFMAPS